MLVVLGAFQIVFLRAHTVRGTSLIRLSDLELREGEPPTRGSWERDEQVALESTMVVNVLHKYVILMYDPSQTPSSTESYSTLCVGEWASYCSIGAT